MSAPMISAPQSETARSVLSRIAAIAALLAAVLYFGFALLAIFPAPTYRLWQTAILATELGHVLWLIGVPFLFALRFRGIPRAAAGIALAASLLLLTPSARSLIIARQLPLPLAGLRDGDRTRPGRLQMAIEFYKPGAAGPARAPLVIMIHGGSWRGGSPSDLASLNYRLADLGYAVAAITYRFAPEYKFPAQLDDVRVAIEYLKESADSLRFDSTRIVLLGRSAGGQLALLTAYIAEDPGIRGVISFYGPTDLVWGYEHPSAPLVHDSRRILRDYLGGTPGTHGPAYRDASPITHAATAPATLLVHGARDELVFPEHSRRLARALRAAGRSVTHIELPWATHACDYIFTGPCGVVSTRAVESFLAEVFR